MSCSAFSSGPVLFGFPGCACWHHHTAPHQPQPCHFGLASHCRGQRDPGVLSREVAVRILRFKFVARRAYSPCTHPAFHHLRACFSHICISRIFLRFLHVGLKAAITAMIANGIDETSSEVPSLKDSLAKAKRNAQEPSASIQLKGAKEFVERVRKRLAAHDAQHAVLEKELVDGETRVQRLAQVHRVGC